MRIRHYYNFQDISDFSKKKLDVEAWEKLRESGFDAFSIEEDLESWEENCKRAYSYRTHAEYICKEILTEMGGKKCVQLV